jgi:peptide/nickel transport system substrate-binding protein
MLADFEPAGFSELNSGQDSPINRPMWQMMHDFMMVFDPNGAPIARLVTELPSQERGTWTIHPDGTMETTYHLKPGVRWHDGTEFTAADMIVGWQVAVDPSLPYNRRAVAVAIDHLETPDPHTVVASWKQTYPWADRIQPNDWDPMPQHLIGPAYTADPSGVTKLDYWRGGFVGLGAYQLVSWDPGSAILMQANRDYHLGPPKIDRIEVRFVTDENARLASLLAGDADMIAAQMGTLGLESRRVLGERWAAMGGGTITAQGAASFNSLMPKWSNPLIGGARNAPTRQGLLLGLDRGALAEVAQGDASLVVDSWIYPNVPEFDVVKDRIVRYPYNLDRATRTLQEAGWRPGSDGVLQSAQGERFEVEVRAEERAGAVIRDSWRLLGVDATILVPPASLSRNQEWQANYPGFVTTGTTPTPSAMLDGRLHSRNCPSEANRWGGQNRQCYQNLEIDSLVERVFVSIDERARWDLDGEIARTVTQEAAIFPTYRSPRGYAILRRGITGVPVMQVLGQSGDLQVTSNVADWDMQP